VTEQGTLFETPAEANQREWAELVEAWWASHEWHGRYRCPLCGRPERTRFAFTLNHAQPPGSVTLARTAKPGQWCVSLHLTRIAALRGLRTGDRALWRHASMTLREMAAARIGARR